MDGTAKSAESRADNITTGALALGAKWSNEAAVRQTIERAREAGVPEAELPKVPDAMVRSTVAYARELVQLIERVADARLERASHPEQARPGARSLRAYVSSEGVRAIEATPAGLTTPAEYEREMAAMAETYGPLATPADDSAGERLATPAEMAVPSRSAAWPFEPLVRDCAETEGGLTGVATDLGDDGDLDGPAGDERAPFAVMAEDKRAQAHFASIGSGVARADLDGLLEDVAKLVRAHREWLSHDGCDFSSLSKTFEAIDALALSAGQLRPSKLAGGQ